jgi:hypothetical protein
MKTITALLISLFFSGSLAAQENTVDQISDLLDAWHKAAADNDQEGYFQALDDQCIYIGTDSSEHWTRQQFYDWSTPYFNEKKGWAFRKKSRNIYLSEDGTMAWFDELLDYGKGILRGSGVLIKRDTGWRIVQYVLSVPVPNDKYKEVMGLINAKPLISEDAEE